MATWGFAAVIILGLGLPVSRVARLRGPTAIRSALWAGLAVLAAVVTLVNLWEPLRGWPAMRIVLVLAAAGAAVGLVPWRSSRTRLTHGWRRVGPATWLLSAFAMVVLAVGSSLSPTHYDFGLYHFSMVRLAADYPAIPGAVNLPVLPRLRQRRVPWPPSSRIPRGAGRLQRPERAVRPRTPHRSAASARESTPGAGCDDRLDQRAGRPRSAPRLRRPPGRKPHQRQFRLHPDDGGDRGARRRGRPGPARALRPHLRPLAPDGGNVHAYLSRRSSWRASLPSSPRSPCGSA